MNLKSYNQYLNEDLNGEYNYYGAGSLFPIVQKLKQEGKSPKVIYVYLTSLGIDEERKQKVISQVFMNESFDFETMKADLSEIFEASLFEDGDKPSPDEIDDLLNADSKDLAKGVDPAKAKKDDDFKKSLDKLNAEPVEPEKDKEDDNAGAEKQDSKSKLDVLQAVIKDAEKLEKIREILKESSLNESSYADKYANIIINDEWIDEDDFKQYWNSRDFAEYVDKKLDLYNDEELKGNHRFDNSKGHILNAIQKILVKKYKDKYSFL